jgi:hypothetical protein
LVEAEDVAVVGGAAGWVGEKGVGFGEEGEHGGGGGVGGVDVWVVGFRESIEGSEELKIVSEHGSPSCQDERGSGVSSVLLNVTLRGIMPHAQPLIMILTLRRLDIRSKRN